MKDYTLPEIACCGYFNCIEKFGNLSKSPERISKCIEIELFLEDGYSTFINNKELKILKNHIIVAKKGSKRYSILPFKTIYLKIFAEGKIEEILNNLPDYFPAIRTDKIIKLLNDIILLNEKKEENKLLLGAKILHLIDSLVMDANHLKNEDYTIYPLMHEAKKIIEQKFNEKISTKDIAKEINLSESRFRFLFNKTYGVSPHQYLIDVRIMNAKQMLWSNASMTDIALNCGFGCQQYFSEIFKRETGLTPKNYKKELERNYHD